ncbi:hypothetical protein [uncultured Mediterranean phage uvMED]|jgi:hypothetical protein|nr:hypothetical protein [uncultured Mediterranean phage uvMED]
MSYAKIHILYENKFGELPFTIRDIKNTEIENEISELLQEALVNETKLTDEQINQVIEIPDLPEGAKI